MTGESLYYLVPHTAVNSSVRYSRLTVSCNTRYGGAITAALFLQEFVSKKKPFAHLDIAGPVWDDKVGSTGFGAKLVSEWVRKQGE